MFSFITSLLHGLRRPRRFGLGYEPLFSLEVTRELEDMRKFSLNSLMMFLSIHLIAGSNALTSWTLALLVYTISLHLAISASFLQDCPALSRLLHVIPFLGISCMAIVELIMGAHSPALAAGGLLVGTLPLLIIAIYRARSCGEMHLPVRLRNVAPPVPCPTETTVIRSQGNSHTPRRRFDIENLKQDVTDDA